MAERNISIKKAAATMAKSEQFVRLGLQRQILPFGSAIKVSSKWTYYISPNKFYEYIGVESISDEKELAESKGVEAYPNEAS